MLLRRAALAAALFVTARSTARAQDVPVGPTARDTLSLNADVGFVMTSGNSSVTTLTSGQRVRYRTGRVALEENSAIIYGRSDGVTNASQYRAGLRASYDFDPRSGAYLLGNWDRNTFAGIARRFEEGVGLTVALVNGPRDQLGIEAGVSLFQILASPDTAQLPTQFPAGRAALTYRHKFSERAFFSQWAEVLPNLDTTEDVRFNSETTLTAPLSKRLAIKLSYVIRFANLPPVGVGKTDQTFTSGLQFTL